MYWLYTCIKDDWQLTITSDDVLPIITQRNQLRTHYGCLIFREVYNGIPTTHPHGWNLTSSPSTDLVVQLLTRGERLQMAPAYIHGFSVMR